MLAAFFILFFCSGGRYGHVAVGAATCRRRRKLDIAAPFVLVFLFCVAFSSENLAYDSRNVLVASFFNYYFLLLVCVWIYFFRETESIRDAQALFCHEEEDN